MTTSPSDPATSPAPVDRAACIFGNQVSEKDYRRACASKAKYARKFGDDSQAVYHLEADVPPVVGRLLGVRRLGLAGGSVETAASSPRFDLFMDATSAGGGEPIVVGNIRMGFGHYRIAMAMASAAHALGYTPYWFDLCGFLGTTCTKVVAHQNDLYSMGSRLSQKIGPFNRLYWEPLNSEGFRKLSYNASDQKNAELFVPVYRDLPRNVPFIGTHVWPAQGAVHAGLTHVVNAIPDNWPMALHLAEGSIHAVQTPGAALGYRALRGMDPNRALKPMPAEALVCTGHYIDHELVSNIEKDCAARKDRLLGGGAVRYLLTVGGAGAQGELYRGIVQHLLPYVERGEAVLLINVGDHRDVWDSLVSSVPALRQASCHFDDFSEVRRIAEALLGEKLGGAEEASTEKVIDAGIEGVHAFCDADIFSAVYSTNLLMRASDVLVTKPSELAFYPVPKLIIRRVGGHEAWGAIRAAEVGDGTYELAELPEICAMVDLFQHDRAVVSTMCDAIMKNKAAGIYDGAYNVVRLAVNGR